MQILISLLVCSTLFADALIHGQVFVVPKAAVAHTPSFPSFQHVLDDVTANGAPNVDHLKELEVVDTVHLENVPAQTATFWLDQMDHTGAARGYAPFIDNYYTYPVYRNVLNYGAHNDGTGDQSDAIQNALNTDGRGGNRYQSGVTTEPAQVFLPGGTYLLSKQLDLRMGTIIMGDPKNPPILKASHEFTGDTLINGYDFASGHHEDSFMTQLRNVVIDTTALSPSQNISALQWGVAQACALGNVKIDMPDFSTGHIGINLSAGSTTAVTDVQISGGHIGILNSNQQVNFKNIYFKGCTTAYVATGGWTSLLQGVTFDTCGLGVDLTQGDSDAGDLLLLDSVSTNSGLTLLFRDSSNDSGNRNNQIVIDNLKHDTSHPIANTSDGGTVLPAQNKVDTWVWGNADPGNYQRGTAYTTSRPASLVTFTGSFFTMDAPTYANYTLDQIVNVKAVSGFVVKGDGNTDDSTSLNAILEQNAASGKVSYFPYGVYIVRSTLFIPPGSQIMGEAWPVISGAGSAFSDDTDPTPVVKIGKFGQTGMAHISDMRFTVAEVLPGAKIVEVNLAGPAGSVGIWNSLITIGGTGDTAVHTACTSQDTSSCKAAFVGLHLTASSSTYVQNLWVWTADHNLDGGPIQIISTGRGILVEATQGTWLVGTSSEHNWLYNYNLHIAKNVFAGLQQTETPYMQGADAVQIAPAPWTANATFGDPDFSWCAGGDDKCRTSVAINVDTGKNLSLYASANWAFFNGPWDGLYDHQCAGSCQTNMNRVTGSQEGLYWYGVNTKSADVMILDGAGNPSQFNNPGSWGGNLVAYRQFV